MALRSQDMAFGFSRPKVQSSDTLNCVGKHLRAFDATHVNAQSSPTKWGKSDLEAPRIQPTYKVEQRPTRLYTMITSTT